MPDDFISSDAASIEFPQVTLQEAVRGDRRTQLEAIRDYIAHELEAHLCNACRNSRLRTGDQAALILRLQTVLAELEGLPKGGEGQVNDIDRIRNRKRLAARPSGPPVDASADPVGQRRSGSRRPGAGGGART